MTTVCCGGLFDLVDLRVLGLVLVLVCALLCRGLVFPGVWWYDLSLVVRLGEFGLLLVVLVLVGFWVCVDAARFSGLGLLGLGVFYVLFGSVMVWPLAFDVVVGFPVMVVCFVVVCFLVMVEGWFCLRMWVVVVGRFCGCSLLSICVCWQILLEWGVVGNWWLVGFG